MFWDKWIPEKYLVKSEICALELCYREEGLTYYYTLLSNKKNKLDVIEKGSCADLNQLPAQLLKNKIPLVLILNGKGIIIKKVSLNEQETSDTDKLIRENMPAIHADEFYAQVQRQKNNSAFISLCRKEHLDHNLSILKNKKYEIARVLIGATAITGLEPLWDKYNFIPTSLHLAELSDASLDNLTQLSPGSANHIKIDELVVESNHTLGFASGLSYFMRRNLQNEQSEMFTNINKSHTEKNRLKFISLLFVALAFLLAVGNVLVYTSYFDENNTLETELAVYQGKYEQINQLLSDYQKNKDLIENAGVLNKNKLNEYADKIGKTLPEEVVLSEMYFNPKKENDDYTDSLQIFETKKLVLKGNCSKSFIVNEWINVLKMQKFIKDVSLEKFMYRNDGLLPNFELKLITE